MDCPERPGQFGCSHRTDGHPDPPGLDNVLASTLRADPDYRLAAAIPVNGNTVTYYVWVRR